MINDVPKNVANLEGKIESTIKIVNHLKEEQDQSRKDVIMEMHNINAHSQRYSLFILIRAFKGSMKYFKFSLQSDAKKQTQRVEKLENTIESLKPKVGEIDSKLNTEMTKYSRVLRRGMLNRF